MAEVAPVTKPLSRSDPPQETTLRRMIDAERQALDRSLDRLDERIKETFDWRTQASRHRGALIAAASGAAFLGAWRWRRRRTPAQRAAAAVVEGAREITAQACDTIANLGSLVSVRRRVPKHLLAPLAAAALRAAVRWWDGERAGAAHREPAPERVHEEERWRLERTS